MPRSARRSADARPGPNRMDLLNPGPEAIKTAPGQTYGEAAQQQLAQRAAPMGAAPIAGGGPPQTASGPPDMASVLAAAQAHNGPGNASFTRPTERPNEPVTSGLPAGPGPGPESLQGVGVAAREGVVQQGTLRNLLTTLAAAPGATTAVRDLAARAVGGVQ